MRRTFTILALALLGALLLAAPAGAAFGFKDLQVRFVDEDGSAATQAGLHPFAMETELDFNTHLNLSSGKVVSEEPIKDLVADLPVGLAVDPRAVPYCATSDFREIYSGNQEGECPDSSAVGVLEGRTEGLGSGDLAPVYNLEPPPGVASRLGLHILGVVVIIEGGLRGSGDRNLFAEVFNQSQAADITGSKLTLWGNPGDPVHDSERGHCLLVGGSCPSAATPRPLLTLPRHCGSPLTSSFAIDSWVHPGLWVGASSAAAAMSGCGKLGLAGSISARPTSKAATSPTGLDFSLDVNDEGLTSAKEGALAGSDIEKAIVTLPQGISVNPSQAEGLEVCTETQLERETAFSAPGEGCPQGSKIGTTEVETPLLAGDVLKGSLYIAKPYENQANDSLLALYIVVQDPGLGIVIKQAARVEPNPVTGQLTTISEDMPQLPFSHFRLHFREGARSPLVTPSACGSYHATALLYPSSGNPPLESTSAFEIVVGPGEAPCPPAGLPPFHPHLDAGTLSNSAGRFSQFDVRLSRSDSEQEITHFSIKLPPGVVGKLAGIPFCSDAQIAQAASRTGPHGGAEELASPSCAAASYVGRTLVGAGVGPSLTYAPGRVYLAGPYHGAPISLVSITAGVVGPFDIGTVVVREALRIDPETAEVFIDATNSDPIPHIIKGIPVHLRDIRIYTDRPEFVLNPTSCERTSTASTVLGAGLDFASSADNNPFVATSPFQAADCASLGFKPRLSLRLRGETNRSGNPALRAVLRPRIGDANAARISVALPHSEFLDQSHIRTVCTRVQFKAGAGNGSQCPAGSIYGHARAWTPLFDQPLEGPIFLRSSEHPLPDLVLALHGLVDIQAVGRIDSVNGGIRNTFDFVPDAPVTKVVVNFQGGSKGLLENSTDLCGRKHRAKVEFRGHNGRRSHSSPLLRAKCPRTRKQAGHKRSA